MTTQWQAKSQAAQSEFIFVDTKLKRDAFKEVVKVNAMRKLHNKRQRHQSSHLYPNKGGELQLWIQSTAQSKSNPKREYPEIRRHVVNHPVTTCNEADQRASMRTPAGSVVTPETVSCVSSYSPYDRLGAGRCDPFRQYPYQTSHYVDRLVDYCTSRLIMPCSYFRTNIFIQMLTPEDACSPSSCCRSTEQTRHLSAPSLLLSQRNFPRRDHCILLFFRTKQKVKHCDFSTAV